MKIDLDNLNKGFKFKLYQSDKILLKMINQIKHQILIINKIKSNIKSNPTNQN